MKDILIHIGTFTIASLAMVCFMIALTLTKDPTVTNFLLFVLLSLPVSTLLFKGIGSLIN